MFDPKIAPLFYSLDHPTVGVHIEASYHLFKRGSWFKLPDFNICTAIPESIAIYIFAIVS